jgi:predicted nuclease with RNAse H fold
MARLRHYSDQMHRYLGVDVGGAGNTWMAAVVERNHQAVELQVSKTTLQKVVADCQREDTMALAIDAQLTFSISRETGFRSSDDHLKKLLHADFRHRVASCNSLMAVPLRGTALAAAVSPFVGTVIETHPTACLLLALQGEDAEIAVRGYKRSKREGEKTAAYAAERSLHSQFLWDQWTTRFCLPVNPPKEMSDGAVDAVVTATVAWLYHRAPERLCKLAPGANDEVGRGPFWVIARQPLPSSRSRQALKRQSRDRSRLRRPGK